jgi:hypothetical protein
MEMIGDIVKETKQPIITVDQIVTIIAGSVDKSKEFCYDCLKEVKSVYTVNNAVVGFIDKKPVRRTTFHNRVKNILMDLRKKLEKHDIYVSPDEMLDQLTIYANKL